MSTPKINQARSPLGSFMSVNNVDENEDVLVNENENVNNDVYVYVKRKKFEDLHTRQTVYIENDIAKKIDKISGKEKGLKTKIYNDALREFLLKNNL